MATPVIAIQKKQTRPPGSFLTQLESGSVNKSIVTGESIKSVPLIPARGQSSPVMPKTTRPNTNTVQATPSRAFTAIDTLYRAVGLGGLGIRLGLLLLVGSSSSSSQ